MTDEQMAEKYATEDLYDGYTKINYVKKRAYLDGLAEGRKEVREHETTCVNRLHHVEKENAELRKLIKDYENDSVEALCKVNDLKAQIKKMKRCGNCKHYSFHLNVCHAHERRVWKTFEDTIACEKWEM